MLSKKEVKIPYPDFKEEVIKEYNKIIGKDVNMLMVPIDDLRSSICKKLELSEKIFDDMMRTFIMRNMAKITVYTQKVKENERGLKLPDNQMIYSISVKGEQLL